MILWDLAEIHRLMVARGWKPNARQLATHARIAYPTAWQIMQGGRIGRIDALTLEALAVAFGLDEPWTLLEYVPD